MNAGAYWIAATKPLLVRPALPRFFVVGDQATIRLAVSNNTGAAIEGPVTLEAEGLTISGQPRQQVEIPASGQAVVEYEVTVTEGDRVTVRAGQRVERGQQIAVSGNTGKSSGPHLHYEISVRGQPVNPRSYLWD